MPKNKKILANICISFMLLTLVSSYNYCLAAADNFKSLIEDTIINGILTPLVSLLVGGAVVVFLWGMFKFIKAEGDEKEKGKDFMIWGIVGIFIMISVWGLVNILTNSFNLENSFEIPSV